MRPVPTQGRRTPPRMGEFESAAREPLTLLMFAPFFPPHCGSEAHATARFALALLRRGHRVDVITSPLPRGTVAAGATLWEALRPYTHVVPKSPLRPPLPLLMRVLAVAATRHAIKGNSWASLALQRAGRLIRGTLYDAILSRSMPAVGHLPALVLSARTQLPWFANWNDIEPAVRAPVPYGQGPSARAGRWLERFLRAVVTSASHHTFPSRRSLNYMSAWYPGLRGRSSVIPHVALCDVAPAAPCANENRFTLCHAGLFDGRRDPAKLLGAVRRLLPTLAKEHTLQLILMGNSYDTTADLELPVDLKPYVKVLPWRPYEEALETMRTADVLVLVEANVEEGIFLPTKFVEYVECGRPVLAISPRVGTIRDLMDAHGGGIVCDCQSEDEIAGGLARFYDLWRRRELQERFPMDSLGRLFSVESVVGEYEKLFSQHGVGGPQEN